MVNKIKKLLKMDQETFTLEEAKPLIIQKLTVNDVPRDLYYALKDDWKRSLGIDDLFTPDEAQTGLLAQFLPYINLGLMVLLLIIVIAK